MKAAVLTDKGTIKIQDLDRPSCRKDQVLIQVEACGICHTDLHLYREEVKPGKLPLIPGHQVVGRVIDRGEDVDLQPGVRVGVGWLASSCGTCKYCQNSKENLCKEARFTGKDVDGGFAELMTAKKGYVFPLPEDTDPVKLAPLLCGGIIGYRAFRLLYPEHPMKIGLFGFGSSAYQVLQIAKSQGHQIYVFTRSESRQRLAKEMGALWASDPWDDPDVDIDGAIVFAPSGQIIKQALRRVAPGGRVVVNAIYATDIEDLKYQDIYMERVLTTVSNYTRKDAKDFIKLVTKTGIDTRTKIYRLDQLENALKDLDEGKIVGSAVVVPG